MDYYVEIRKIEDDELVKRMGPMTEHKAGKVEDGANINLDRENYYTDITQGEPDGT